MWPTGVDLRVSIGTSEMLPHVLLHQLPDRVPVQVKFPGNVLDAGEAVSRPM